MHCLLEILMGATITALLLCHPEFKQQNSGALLAAFAVLPFIIAGITGEILRVNTLIRMLQREQRQGHVIIRYYKARPLFVFQS